MGIYLVEFCSKLGEFLFNDEETTPQSMYVVDTSNKEKIRTEPSVSHKTANKNNDLTVWVTTLSTIAVLAAGGAIDVMTNDSTDKSIAPSHENSDNAALMIYQDQLAFLEQKPKNADLELKKSFMHNTFRSDILSEAQVESLSKRFTENVMTASQLGAGLSLEHAEYLDECKADNPNMDSLEELDACTVDKHLNEEEDGPWLGFLIASMLQVGLFIPIAKNMQNKHENNPSSATKLVANSIRRVQGKLPTNY